ncbi:MAG: ATP-binding cassette domain-containing protein [Candidatus Latescibacteria bacterium]|nr:ATP-binding cassette domain-containing protein [Candidatus Latescibacterota bacterium]NIO56182.1 ATP-binding cassette domain-containing protein [Candidatus Latescibacterota bacterium]
MPPVVISVEQLTKYFGRTVGIEQISFDVRKGEIFGFLGLNGAGKTTTIRLLLDLLRPTNGRAVIFGLAVLKHSYEIRRRCGYLPGNFTGYGHMTGSDFLSLAADIRGTVPPLQHGLLNRFEISEDTLMQKIKHLSHGTRQKLGIIQAFFHKPELIILDEPTIGLDPLMQEKFYALLRDSKKEGCTIFFSSHNLAEVEKVCERVAIIRDGELVALETLDGLKQKRYRRLFISLRERVDHLELPGAELLKHKDLDYEFLVKGDMNDLIRRLSHLPLENVIFPEPDLEEVFMAYYRSERHE